MRGSRRTLSWIAIAVLTLITLDSGVAAADKRNVGVVVSLRVNASAEVGNDLAGRMGVALSKAFDINVVAGQAAAAKLPATLPDTCIAEPACVADIGKRLGADEILFIAVISLSANAIQLDVTSVEVSSGKASSREMLEVDPKSPDEAIAGHVRKWLPDAPARKAPPTVTSSSSSSTSTQDPTPPRGAVPALQRDSSDASRLHMTSPAWIAAGSTVVAVGLGTTFALLARSQYKDLDSSCPETCDKDGLALKNGLADGFFAASAVGAGLTAYFFLTSGGEEQPPPVSLMGDRERIAVSFSSAF